MTAARIVARLLLAATSTALASPAFSQTLKDKSPPPPAAAAPSAVDAAAFDTDTYTCQNVLDDLAAGRQAQIGIAVVVTYAQLRAETTPSNHSFSMAAIQVIASGAGASCATGDHNRLLRNVVGEQMAKVHP